MVDCTSLVWRNTTTWVRIPLLAPILYNKAMKKQYIGRIGWKGQEVCETVPIKANSLKEAKRCVKEYADFAQGQNGLKKKWIGVIDLDRWFLIPLEYDKDGNLI